MIETVIIMCKIFLIVFTVTRFEPLQWVLEALPDKLLFNMFSLALTCSKCLSLWLTLVITKDIYLAMLMSLILTIFEKTIGAWLNRVTF